MSAFAMVAFGVLLAQPAAEGPDGIAPTKLTLDDVIKNVQKNEKLYETFEMRVREESKWVGQENQKIPGVQRERPGPKVGERTAVKTTTVHVILDGECFLQKQNIASKSVNSKDWRKHEAVIACDGKQTRRIGGDPPSVQIQEGRECPNDLWHPNTLLYLEWNLPAPFSKYLTMPDTKSHDMRWTVLGEEQVDGLRCVKLKFEMAYKDVEHVIETNTTSWFEAYFWLAMDRNYLPIRSVGVSPRNHPTLDHSIRRITSLKEIKTGIWVPERGDHVIHDSTELKKGMMIPRWEREFQVEEVILGKEYDVEVFRPEIPEGAKIYK